MIFLQKVLNDREMRNSKEESGEKSNFINLKRRSGKK